MIIEYVGSVCLIFHSMEDGQVTLESVSFIPSLKVNLLSLRTIQAKETITLDATGAHLMGGRFVSPDKQSRVQTEGHKSPLPLFLFSSLTGYTGFDDLDAPSPPRLLARCCGKTGEDAGNICFATFAGGDGDGSGRGVFGSWFPPSPPYALCAGSTTHQPPPPLIRRWLWYKQVGRREYLLCHRRRG